MNRKIYILLIAYVLLICFPSGLSLKLDGIALESKEDTAESTLYGCENGIQSGLASLSKNAYRWETRENKAKLVKVSYDISKDVLPFIYLCQYLAFILFFLLNILDNSTYIISHIYFSSMRAN